MWNVSNSHFTCVQFVVSQLAFDKIIFKKGKTGVIISIYLFVTKNVSSIKVVILSVLLAMYSQYWTILSTQIIFVW